MLPIQINPCSEKLSGSINFNGDKFCATCNKRIYNFSKMSDEELISFLSKPKENACGIFDASQVIESTRMDVSNLKRRTTWKSILATLAATVISFTAFSQEKKDSTKIISPNNFTIIPSDSNQTKNMITISGIVTDSATNKPLGFIYVALNGKNDVTKFGTFTNTDGTFKFSIPKIDLSEISKIVAEKPSYFTVSVNFSVLHFEKDFFVGITIAKNKNVKPIIIGGIENVKSQINSQNPNTHKFSPEEIRKFPY